MAMALCFTGFHENPRDFTGFHRIYIRSVSNFVMIFSTGICIVDEVIHLLVCQGFNYTQEVEFNNSDGKLLAFKKKPPVARKIDTTYFRGLKKINNGDYKQALKVILICITPCTVSFVRSFITSSLMINI
uniref:Uncharacterized protein n=1 Tax=Strigamia maritima TaxID=126957 RepID=T1JJQ5_STRMM